MVADCVPNFRADCKFMVDSPDSYIFKSAYHSGVCSRVSRGQCETEMVAREVARSSLFA